MTDYDELVAPRDLYTAAQVLGRPSAVPASPGVYAWYFTRVPPMVPHDGCVTIDGGLRLLYVGISPRTFTVEGRSSRQTLRSRLRYHYRGNAYGSTLRLSLGCLLQDELGIRLQRVGSGTRLTFGSGESQLSAWMEQHTRVIWLEHPRPELVEDEMIDRLDLPLNLAHNQHHPFQTTLSARRSEARAAARAESHI